MGSSNFSYRMSRGPPLTRHSTGEDGLYELGTDDDERTNFASTQPELRNELVDQLTDALLTHSDAPRGVYS